MRILGVDLGDKRVGLAICDREELIASPLGMIERTGDLAADIAAVISRAQEEEAEEIVVGMPMPLSGVPNARYAITEEFVLSLREASPIPVATADERMTTKIAQAVLIEGGVRRNKRKQVVDQMAAALILEGHLAARKRKQTDET